MLLWIKFFPLISVIFICFPNTASVATAPTGTIILGAIIFISVKQNQIKMILIS